MVAHDKTNDDEYRDYMKSQSLHNKPNTTNTIESTASTDSTATNSKPHPNSQYDISLSFEYLKNLTEKPLLYARNNVSNVPESSIFDIFTPMVDGIVDAIAKAFNFEEIKKPVDKLQYIAYDEHGILIPIRDSMKFHIIPDAGVQTTEIVQDKAPQNILQSNVVSRPENIITVIPTKKFDTPTSEPSPRLSVGTSSSQAQDFISQSMHQIVTTWSRLLPKMIELTETSQSHPALQSHLTIETRTLPQTLPQTQLQQQQHQVNQQLLSHPNSNNVDTNLTLQQMEQQTEQQIVLLDSTTSDKYTPILPIIQNTQHSNRIARQLPIPDLNSCLDTSLKKTTEDVRELLREPTIVGFATYSTYNSPKFHPSPPISSATSNLEVRNDKDDANDRDAKISTSVLSLSSHPHPKSESKTENQTQVRTRTKYKEVYPLYLNVFGITSTLRGLGLGHILLSSVFSSMIKQDTDSFQGVTLDVDVSNTPAIHTYKSAGFGIRECKKNYYFFNEKCHDAYNMFIDFTNRDVSVLTQHHQAQTDEKKYGSEDGNEGGVEDGIKDVPPQPPMTTTKMCKDDFKLNDSKNNSNNSNYCLIM